MPGKRGRKARLGNAELALAMELRTQSISWKLIAYGLNVEETHLIKRVARAQQEGMSAPPGRLARQ